MQFLRHYKVLILIISDHSYSKLLFHLPHVSLVCWQAHRTTLSLTRECTQKAMGHIQLKNMCRLKNMFWFGLIFPIWYVDSP